MHVNDQFNKITHGQVKPHVRYDFKWLFSGTEEKYVSAIVTRNEWANGFTITNSPTNASKFKIKVDENSIQMKPAPGETVFRAIPEDERVSVIAVARSYYNCHVNRMEQSFWLNLED